MKAIEYAKAAVDTMMRKFDAEKLPPEGHFHYHQGVFLQGVYQTYLMSGDERYLQYIKGWVDSIMDENGKIYNYNPKSLDDIQPGVLLFPLIDRFGDEKYRNALEMLMKNLEDYPKNPDGGFWHNDKHVDEMWLDGLYMGGPIMAKYAIRYDQRAYLDESVKQVLIMREKTRDCATGLWYHAWDYHRKQEWADPDTGCSPEFWGRSLGWIPTALMDELDDIPKEDEAYGVLADVARELLETVCTYQGESGCWYQVVNRGNDEGNWEELSCSCLFINAICRAVKKGILDESYLQQAKKGYQGVIAKLKWAQDDLLVGDVCVGTWVGDYQFYCDRPVSVNDLHGVGAFLLMCSAVHECGF